MSRRDWDLLSLPNDVLCLILSSMVTLKEFVRLDSAYCHVHLRNLWLQLLQSKQFIFHQSMNLADDLLEWIQKRSIKASNIKFCNQINDSEVSNYLRVHGSSVRNIHFFRQGSHSLNMRVVAIFCKNLSNLHITSAAVSTAFTDILWCNSNIQEVWYDAIDSVSTNAFKDIFLDKVKCVRITKSDFCLASCLWQTTVHGAVHTAVLDKCTNFNLRAFQVLVTCPHLRSLSLSGVQTSEFLFTTMAARMSHIINLSLAGNNTVTDAEILHIGTFFPVLRSLNIRSCATLTDLSIKYLGHHCEHILRTLHTLHTDLKTPFSADTENTLEIFTQKSTQLEVLCINCDEMLCLGRCTSLLVKGCPKLRTLVVNSNNVICATSRELIRVLRPTLKIRVHDESTEYDVLSMSI